MVVEKSIKKSLNHGDFNRNCSGNGSGSGGGSSARSYMTCPKCGKKFHSKKDCRSKVNGSGGNPTKKSANELS